MDGRAGGPCNNHGGTGRKLLRTVNTQCAWRKELYTTNIYEPFCSRACVMCSSSSSSSNNNKNSVLSQPPARNTRTCALPRLPALAWRKNPSRLLAHSLTLHSLPTAANFSASLPQLINNSIKSKYRSVCFTANNNNKNLRKILLINY